MPRFAVSWTEIKKMNCSTILEAETPEAAIDLIEGGDHPTIQDWSIIDNSNYNYTVSQITKDDV